MSSMMPDGMVEGQQLHERAEPDLRRRFGRGGEEDLLVRREAEVGAVVLGEVVADEARCVGQLHQFDAVAQQLVHRRAVDALDVVEDSELHVGHPSMWTM